MAHRCDKWAMSNLYDLVFNNSTLNAEVIYSGTTCDRENSLCDYRAGTLHFIRHGHAKLTVLDMEPVPIEAPSLIFFPRASRHRVNAVDDAGVQMICAVARFGETFSCTVAISFPAVVIMPLAARPEVLQALGAFFIETALQEQSSQHLSNRLCEVLLCYLTRDLSVSGQLKPGLMAASTDKRIACAVVAIHTRYQKSLDLEMLAETAGMSRSRFVARFRELVGTSPHQYLLNHRIDVARQLLRNGIAVKVVAQRVGYASASAFMRKFKEVVGTSPGHWSE